MYCDTKLSVVRDGFFLKLNDASILRLKIRLLLILHPSMTKIIAQKEKKIKYRKKKTPSSRIRTSDLRITVLPLQSSALPTELSKESCPT